MPVEFLCVRDVYGKIRGIKKDGQSCPRTEGEEMSEIQRIKCGNVNCYIIENGTDGILVDTGKRILYFGHGGPVANRRWVK